MSLNFSSYGGGESAFSKYTGYAYALSIAAILIIVFLVPSFGVDYDEKYQMGALRFAVIFMATFGLLHGFSSGNLKSVVGLPYLKL